MELSLKSVARILIFALIGAAVGLLYYYFIGCNGSCVIGASPYRSMLYLAVVGILMSFVTQR